MSITISPAVVEYETARGDLIETITPFIENGFDDLVRASIDVAQIKTRALKQAGDTSGVISEQELQSAEFQALLMRVAQMSIEDARKEVETIILPQKRFVSDLYKLVFERALKLRNASTNREPPELAEYVRDIYVRVAKDLLKNTNSLNHDQLNALITLRSLNALQAMLPLSEIYVSNTDKESIAEQDAAIVAAAAAASELPVVKRHHANSPISPLSQGTPLLGADADGGASESPVVVRSELIASPPAATSQQRQHHVSTSASSSSRHHNDNNNNDDYSMTPTPSPPLPSRQQQHSKTKPSHTISRRRR